MRPAAAKSDTVPWFSKTKSSAGSWFDSRNRMIDVPVATPCLKLSIRNAGWPVCASPNWSLKMSTQLGPHDGVAAFAAPAVSPTAAPPTSVSEAAVASILPLKDIADPSLEPQPRPARSCVKLSPPQFKLRRQQGLERCPGCRAHQRGNGREQTRQLGDTKAHRGIELNGAVRQGRYLHAPVRRLYTTSRYPA